ncbi:MAG TPA: response regulator [Pirellulales bacterium]|jgi:CheY-like chemotaxis protein
MIDLSQSEVAWTEVSGGLPARWPLHVLLIGDAARREFRECVAQIRSRTQAIEIVRLDEALGSMAYEPDLIVLLAGRPGEFAAGEVERLWSWAPLARIVALTGSWCEGESRTGRPWPAVPRIYWHQWPAWFEREMTGLERHSVGTLTLPVTATEEERMLCTAESARDHAHGTIAIYSAELEARDMLAEVFRACGYEVAPIGTVAALASVSLTAGVCDFSNTDADRFTILRELAAHRPDIPWFALLNFPRDEDRQAVLECGARGVLSKPLSVSDLQETLERHVARDGM